MEMPPVQTMSQDSPVAQAAGIALLDRQHLRHQTLGDKELARIVLGLFLWSGIVEAVDIDILGSKMEIVNNATMSLRGVNVGPQTYWVELRWDPHVAANTGELVIPGETIPGTYKLYAESFRDEGHLRWIQQDAKDAIAHLFEQVKTA